MVIAGQMPVFFRDQWYRSDTYAGMPMPNLIVYKQKNNYDRLTFSPAFRHFRMRSPGFAHHLSAQQEVPPYADAVASPVPECHGTECDGTGLRFWMPEYRCRRHRP